MTNSSFANLVKVTTATTGQSTITLGAAASGFRGVSALTDGATYSYHIQDVAQFEDGQGVFDAETNTLTRAIIDDSSNGGLAISLTGNASVIVGTLLARDLTRLDPTYAAIVAGLGFVPQGALGYTPANKAGDTFTGPVGIGAAPSQDFHVYGANAAITLNEVAAAGSGVASWRLKYDTYQYGAYVGATNALVFYDYGASAERMRIDAAGNMTLTGKLKPNIQSTTSASIVTPNANSDSTVSINALAAGATIAAPSGTPHDGQKMVIRIKDNGSSQTLSWNAVYINGGAALPTSTTAGKWHHIGLIYNTNNSSWMCVGVSVQP